MRLKSALPVALLALVTLSAGLAAAGERPNLTPQARAKLVQAARACHPDIQSFCAGVKRGEGRILLCLGEHKNRLAPACATAMDALWTP